MSQPEQPKLGKFYSREEISRMFGGSSWTYLPRDGGDVVSGCFRPDLNPKAPDEVLVGHGKMRISSAKRLVEQGTPVPVFIQRGSRRWEFIGRYRGKRYSDSAGEVTPRARAANIEGQVAGVLYLEKAEDS